MIIIDFLLLSFDPVESNPVELILQNYEGMWKRFNNFFVSMNSNFVFSDT